MVSRQQASARVAERYITQRTMAHNATHMAALKAHTGSVESYYDGFRNGISLNETWFAEQCEAIDSDELLNSVQKRDEKLKIAERRIYPAWSGVGPGKDCGQPKPTCQHKECAFLRTYGDPRKSPDFAGRMEALRLDYNEGMRGSDGQTTWDKTEWELTLYGALVHPNDGSIVAMVETATEEQAPVPADLTVGQLKGLELLCPHCGNQKGSKAGLSQHVKTCRENPDYEVPAPKGKAETADTEANRQLVTP